MKINSEKRALSVLYYQIFIAAVIIISAIIGRVAFYIAIAIAVLWTLAMVKTGELFVMQLITVVVSGIIGRAILTKETKRT